MYPGLRYAQKKCLFPGLRYAQKKCFFLDNVSLSTNFDLRLKKIKENFGAILNLLVIQF